MKMKLINPIFTYINIILIASKSCPSFITDITITLPFIVILIFTRPAYGTTIIALRDANQIIVGADSLVEHTIKKSDCKIRQIGSYFIAFAGYPFIGTPTPERFNIIDIFRQSIQGNQGTLKDKMLLFAPSIEAKLTTVLELTRNARKELFNTLYMQRDKIVLSVIVAGVEKKIPIFSTIEYQIVSSIDEPVRLKRTPHDFTYAFPPNNPPDGILYGNHLEIEKSIKEEEIPNNSASITTVLRWINLEIKANPSRVGPPIDILRITPQGAEWIQHKKPECEEIQ
jgi:hypothetical protein